MCYESRAVDFYRLEEPKGFKGSAADLGGSCGAEKAWIDFVPDSFIGVCIKRACKIHDYCYQIGGTKKDKDHADRMFRSNLRALVLNDSGLIFRSTNLSLCELYYIAVVRYGNSSFNFHE